MRRLGATALEVSPVCLGTSNFGASVGERQAHRLLDAFVANGGNFIDTADVYPGPGDGGGMTERMLGRWIQRRGMRDRIILATKVGGEVGLSSIAIRDSVQASLRRLGVDHVDLLYTHIDDLSVPVREIRHALQSAVEAGWTRYIGASNITAARLAESLIAAEDGARLSVVQPEYNLAMRRPFEQDLRPICLAEGVAVVPYRALAAGAFNRWAGPRERQRVRQAYRRRLRPELLWTLHEAARCVALSPTAVAFAWLRAQAGVVAPVFGASSSEHVEEILRAARIDLPEEIVAELDAASERALADQ